MKVALRLGVWGVNVRTVNEHLSDIFNVDELKGGGFHLLLISG